MASVTVRNLDADVVSFLKMQAKANNRSLEGEIRNLLCQQALRGERVDAFRKRAEHLHSLTIGVPQTDSAHLIREDRNR